MFKFISSLLKFFYETSTGNYSPESRGNIGETRVSKILSYSNHCGYILNNVTLCLANGSTTQIDHILVSKKGVFVIETKHYKGWIFGNPKSKTWTQVLYKVKNKFQNPLFQNNRHVRAVQSLLACHVQPRHIHNLVVFTGDAEFKTQMPWNVLYLNELEHTIEQFTDNVMTDNYAQLCANKLNNVRLQPSKETDLKHQAYLRRKFAHYERF